MDLEEMKSQWPGLNSRIDNIETNIKGQKLDKMKTAQQQLISQYRKFAIISMAFTCISFVIFSRLTDNIMISALFAVFFSVCAVMDSVLQHMVGAIDLATMSIIEVAVRAAKCRRLHHIFQLFIIPAAIALVAALAYTMSDNEAFIYGICIGGAIGLATGLIAYFKFMDNYKDLIKQ